MKAFSHPMFATPTGDFPRAVPGVAVTCIFVTLFNRPFRRSLRIFGKPRLRLG